MNSGSDSELNYLIAPEIKDDEFYTAIQRLAQRPDVTTVLEIGSSSGGGSTEAFVKGLRNNPNQPQLFCMEVSKTRFAELRNAYAQDAFVKCYNISSIAINAFPTAAEVTEFYHQYETPLRNFPLERVIGWLEQDIEYVRSSGVPDDGIQCIKAENQIDVFDLVLIDGSEFTGDIELEQVYGAKFILLDDICTYKNYKSHNRLLADPNYALIAQNTSLRNGYSIFRRIDRLEQPTDDLPIHFFTIVLNGEPFIRYHIDIFKQLPFRWHWHIVEGVADLKHDTAWSLKYGGKITGDLHRNGRSTDGTTEYLDELAQLYPEQITIYRKPEGIFWDGKREMVNAPLENIVEECLLWQVDVDELWTVNQFCRGRQLFIDHPDKTAAFYWCWYFVGANLVISSRHCYTQDPEHEWMRTWRFQPGAIWAAHEPPALVKFLLEGKSVDLARLNPFLHHETEAQGLVFQHFAYVTFEQLRFKELYYGYENAVTLWQQLQTQENSTYPIFLRDYFPWVKDETLVESTKACGVVPIAYQDSDPSNWRFLPLDEWQQKTMDIQKPFPTIIVDGMFYQIANSGIAQVWRSLLEEWVKSGFAKHIIFLDRDGTAPRIPGIRYRPVRRFYYHDTATDAQMLQEICDEKGADLFISTYYTTPLTTPSVFMAYDMIPEIIKTDLSQPSWKEKHYGIMHACHYITISENTARDLRTFFPHIPEYAVTSAPCGIKPAFHEATSAEIEAFQSKYHISKPYYLLVGERFGVDGYKNAILFFKALPKMQKNKDFAVVCVGGRPELEPELAHLAGDIPTYVLPLNDDELRAAYAGSIALVYPSLYEGFGLPVAEAMACGCPVITTHCASIPEVGGDAVRYIDPKNLDDLVQALEDVRNPEVRQRFVSAGLERSKQFSWARMAETVANVLLDTAEKLKYEHRLQASPLWKEFREFQVELQRLKQTHPVNRAQLQAMQEQVNVTSEQLRSTQKQLNQTRNQLEKVRRELEQAQGELQGSRSYINAMKTSKFWRMRSKWFRIKRALGLPVKDEMVEF